MAKSEFSSSNSSLSTILFMARQSSYFRVQRQKRMKLLLSRDNGLWDRELLAYSTDAHVSLDAKELLTYQEYLALNSENECKKYKQHDVTTSISSPPMLLSREPITLLDFILSIPFWDHQVRSMDLLRIAWAGHTNPVGFNPWEYRPELNWVHIRKGKLFAKIKVINDQ
ncbi:hypothetical protein L211DRAFT_868706 [Terfezia boudieri ATCC MYA-4762]|uniref:Uncharacterized protein n=1 Tax=Terfezia boudieri ATCC MYA-4762 TaxID=1051890 RepID=A0A3N4LK84_9PEZI|nr:hypothetical protein L211DRAFT_868706 [Terfezia boudieri ATCC MYA-4762]